MIDIIVKVITYVLVVGILGANIAFSIYVFLDS